MNKTKDGTITILLDVNRSINNLYETSESNCDLSKESLSTFLNKLEQQNGNIVKIFFSYVHCPDSIEQYKEDFETLCNFLKNKLTPQEIKNIIKYRSFYFGQET